MEKRNVDGIWRIFSWVGFFSKGGKISIVSGNSQNNELVLYNEASRYVKNFSLNDEREIEHINQLLCLWANKSEDATTDFDGKSIFDFSVGEKINTG